jgi:hypothetical protein
MFDTSSKIGSSTDAVAPMREIPARLNSVEIQVDRFNTLLGDLVTRLDSVIVPGPPRKDEGKTDNVGSVLGNQLNRAYLNLKEQNDGLEFLIKSIQL